MAIRIPKLATRTGRRTAAPPKPEMAARVEAKRAATAISIKWMGVGKVVFFGSGYYCVRCGPATRDRIKLITEYSETSSREKM